MHLEAKSLAYTTLTLNLNTPG